MAQPTNYHVLEDALDPLSLIQPVVDLSSLASSAIPDHPSWVRPRIWRLLLGTLPLEKARWVDETRRSRWRYYNLAQQFLDEITTMPDPTSPLSTRDKLLDSIAKDVRRTQPRLAFFRQRPQPSPFNPLSPTASQPISSLSALTDRILKIEELAANTSIPNPGLQVNDSRPSSRASSSRSPTPTLSIVPPSPPPALPISETHQSSLLRVLFLFSLLHPHQPYTQGLNEVLAPIYYVLASYPFDPRDPAADPAHAEADAFWIFTEIIGEFGAVIGHPDEWARGSEGVGNRFSERLKWADPSLWQFLKRYSLEPELPYWSYRWIACLLAQDLPLPDLLPLWDALFSQSPSTASQNPRLSFLLDICTSMVIRLRPKLIHRGDSVKKIRINLWGGGAEASSESEADEGGEGGQGSETFTNSMQVLQDFPIGVIGARAILQGAYDLRDRKLREEEAARVQAGMGPSRLAAVGSQIRNQIWMGVTNGAEPDDIDHGVSPPHSDDDEDAALSDTASVASSKIRQYADAFRSSDTAASLSKTSTNFTAVAVGAWSSRGRSGTVTSNPDSEPRSPTFEPTRSRQSWSSWAGKKLWGGAPTSSDSGLNSIVEDQYLPGPSTHPSRSASEHSLDERSKSRVISLGGNAHLVSPPPQASLFSSPKDALEFARAGIPGSPFPVSPRLGFGSGAELESTSTPQPFSPGATLRAAFAALPSPLTGERTPPPIPPKSTGPRPLILGSLARTPQSRNSSISSTTSNKGQPWLSVNSDAESSPNTSRKIPLRRNVNNRRGYSSQTTSPRIPAQNLPSTPIRSIALIKHASEPVSYTSSDATTTSGEHGTPQPKRSRDTSLPSSPTTVPSPPPPQTPIALEDSMVNIEPTSTARGSVVLVAPTNISISGAHIIGISSPEGSDTAQAWRPFNILPPLSSAGSKSRSDSADSTSAGGGGAEQNHTTRPGGNQRIRSKRGYSHRPADLTIPKPKPTDGSTTLLSRRSPSPSLLPYTRDGGEDSPLTPLTARPGNDGLGVDQLQLSTSSETPKRRSSRSNRAPSPRPSGPSPRPSPRRAKKELPSLNGNGNGGEDGDESEAGVKGDDEDDYDDFLSAYSESEDHQHIGIAS